MERLQTASLDAELRIRLEGAAERLEEAVALLDTATRTLARRPEELVGDDVGDLKAVLTRWAAVDDALERASRHEEAATLTAAVRRSREALSAQVQAWLARLGKPAGNVGPAEALRQLVGQLKYVGRRAGPSERALFERSDERPWRLFWLLQLAAALVMVAGWPLLGLVLCGLVAAGFFAVTRAAPAVHWRLFPDRLQVEQHDGPLLDVQYEQLTDVRPVSSGVAASTADFSVVLATRRPDGLVRLLRSMMKNLGAASATPYASAVVPVVVDAQHTGKALFTAQGAYVLRQDEYGALVAAMLPGADNADVDRALGLLAHLPPPALAQQLPMLPGEWWPADQLEQAPSANTLSRAFLRSGDERRSLTVVPPGGADVDAVTKAWRLG